MHNNFPWDLTKARAEGLFAAVGQPMTAGPRIRVKSEQEIADALSDLPRLRKISEIEIVGQNHALPTYVKTESLLSNPQVFVGFHHSGYPLLLGVKRVMEGHMTVMGPTRTGKSTMLALVMYQISRLGYAVFVCGHKSVDPIILATLRAAADSFTRLDDRDQLFRVPFALSTLQPNVKTKGFNFLAQKNAYLAHWLKAANLLKALSTGGSESDPNQRYFMTFGQALLQKTDWGSSFRELNANLARTKQDRDTRYATAGMQNEIEQQAAIEQVNVPAGDPRAIDLLEMIQKKGAVYFEACFMDVGSVATATSALFAQAVVSAKRLFSTNPKHIIFLFIDEAQLFNRALLKQLIEQCSGVGIRLILAYHDLDQLGLDAPTISMTQVKIITGAVPGTKTAKYVQDLFGTTTEYQISFSGSDGKSTSQGTSETVGPSGTSVGVSSTTSHSQQTGFGITEREDFTWKPNDTLELNYRRDQFVMIITPGAELSYYGSKALLCSRNAAHMTFDEINKLADDTLNNSPDTFFPGEKPCKQLTCPPLSPALMEKRAHYLDILNKTAARIRREFN
jgi:hypothetical protein